MGHLQLCLERILSNVGRLSRDKLSSPSRADLLHSKQADVVDAVYRGLGGRLSAPEVNLGPWDIEFEGVAVELDEHLHFNRYRAMTLESSAYQDLPRFPLELYRSHCVHYEDACLKAGGHGRKWSNGSCERQFGPSAPCKDLGGGGAPRWKQRAFYDFVKDLSPLIIGVPVVRIAVWDEILDGETRRTVAESLEHPSRAAVQHLVELIYRRGSK